MKPLVKPDYSKYMRRGPSAGAVAGVAAVGFVAGFAAYQAKKMAVQGLTSAKGDWTETIKAELPAETKKRVQAMQLIEGDGVEEDIVQAMLYLASPRARFVTGEVLRVTRTSP